MYFPQFLLGMIVASASVGISTYFKTGSPWVGFASAIISALLLQIGYFVLVVRQVNQMASSERMMADEDASGSEAKLPVRLMTLIAIAALTSFAMADKTHADDDDAYFDCVIGKAEAIMKTQTHRDAEAALERAYALCRDVGSSEQA
jgi:hypothetical protein